jgi:glutamine amidotransferase
MKQILIIDYGMGNLGSIANMLKKIEVDPIISEKPHDIEKAEKLILPGVGAFDNGMKNLRERGLLDVLNKKVLSQKTPILGICLGIQLFTKKSEEGQMNGLAWLDAETVKFKFNKTNLSLKIPHMGWNNVKIMKDSNLFKGLEIENRFYFVHSYHVVCDDGADVLSKTEYGFEFTSSILKGNIAGVQFHPEKSHKFGMRLLENFASWEG